MTIHVSAVASVLADMGHLLESVHDPEQQLRGALVLLERVVPYERCALLDGSGATAGLFIVPEVVGDELGQVRGRLAALYQRLSEPGASSAGPLTLPGSTQGVARLAFPLITRDEATGVLLVERRGKEYGEDHLQLLAVVATLLGGYLASVRLLAEERRASSAVQRAAALLEHIRDGFLELDPEGRCVTANRAAAELLGVPHAQLVGSNLRTVEDLGEKKSFLEACERTRRERAPSRVEAEHYPRRDRWLELEVYPTELGVSVFLRDVSERHATEEFRDLLTGIIGHDLRTPLGAITMSAGSLLQRGNLDGPAAQSVARIARSGARMSEMVSHLLDLTRVRFGKGLVLQRRPMDFGQVCREVVGELSAAHPDREIRCAVSGDLRGAWDSARLSQMLSNLVSNALEHGEPSAPIHLSAQGAGEDGVRIEVHNEGAPIPEESMPTIFQPFRQLGSGRPRKEGLGLGLYIAQSVARAHGGKIEVKSTRESGTSFIVRLPRGALR